MPTSADVTLLSPSDLTHVFALSQPLFGERIKREWMFLIKWPHKAKMNILAWLAALSGFFVSFQQFRYFRKYFNQSKNCSIFNYNITEIFYTRL